MNDVTEQVLKVLGKLDERNTWSIIWVTQEQAKLIIVFEPITFLVWVNKVLDPFDPRGPTLLLLTVVLLWVLRFLPTIPPPGGGMPPMTWHDQQL